MRILNPKIHALIDYLAVLALLLAPRMLGFTGTVAATLCYWVSGIQLVMSLLTAYPGGVIRKIPFPVHGMIELAAAIGLVFGPWLFGFSALISARNFFVISGLVIIGVWSTTNYQAASSKSADYRIGETKNFRRAA